jgi:N-acetylneuraminic acid mutarotase
MPKLRTRIAAAALLAFVVASQAAEPESYCFTFKSLPGAALPDVQATIAEGSDGRVFFASHGPGGSVLVWDGHAMHTVARGDVGGLAVGLSSTCYFTIASDLWLFGWPEANERILLPPFIGLAQGARSVFFSRLGDLWVEGAPQCQTIQGMMRTVPVAHGIPPAPRVTDQHGNLWSLMFAAGALSWPCVLPAGGDEGWVMPGESLKAGEWRWVVADGVGFVWVAGPGAIVRFDPRRAGWGCVFESEVLPRVDVSAFGLSPAGRALAGFSDGSLYELDMGTDGATVVRRILTDGLPAAAIRGVHSDCEGGLWVVAGGSIHRAQATPNAWQRHWRPLAPMPWGNHDICGAALDGRLYAAAGMASHGYPAAYTHFRELFVYDPKADAWAVAGRMEQPRCYSGTAAFDGKVWVMGGFRGPDNRREPIADVEVFDPKTGRFSAGPKLDQPRAEPVVAVAGDRLYVIGGTDGKEELKSVVSIGTAQSEWRRESDAPGPVRQAAGCALDGSIYVCAGPQGVMRFDTRANKWERIAGLEKAPRAPLMAAHRGEIWIMGGYGTDEPRAVLVYSPKDGKWRRGPDLPTPLGWGAAVEIDGRLILAGGAYYSSEHKCYIFSDRTVVLRE